MPAKTNKSKNYSKRSSSFKRLTKKYPKVFLVIFLLILIPLTLILVKTTQIFFNQAAAPASTCRTDSSGCGSRTAVCCNGYTMHPAGKPQAGGGCSFDQSCQLCLNCPNKLCDVEKGENKCNCADDCARPLSITTTTLPNAKTNSYYTGSIKAEAPYLNAKLNMKTRFNIANLYGAEGREGLPPNLVLQQCKTLNNTADKKTTIECQIQHKAGFGTNQKLPYDIFVTVNDAQGNVVTRTLSLTITN